MNTVINKLDAFFRSYEERFMEALEGKVNVEAISNAFANCFVEASPLGVTCGQNDESFRQSIPKGYEFYRHIGTSSMRILNKEITSLDEFHLQCKVYWQARYQKKDGQNETIDFVVIYFLQHLNNNFKIFAYVTGDEQKVLKERGLI